MELFTLILMALAVWQTVEVIHHSELFNGTRVLAGYIADQPLQMKLELDWRIFIAKMYLCPFCLSHWVAIFYALMLVSPLSGLISWWLLILSAVRLANLGNDLASNYTKTPRYEPESSEQKLEP